MFGDCLSLFHGTIEPKRCMNSWFTVREEALSSWDGGTVSEDDGEGGSEGVDVRMYSTRSSDCERQSYLIPFQVVRA